MQTIPVPTRPARARAAAGPAANVPPPSVPLAFLGAAGVGLAAFGIAVAFEARHATEDPRLPGVIAVVHLGVLAFLTTAVLGAVHQFGPVVGQRPLRSVAAARVTFVCMLTAAWLLPIGFAFGPENLLPIGGVFGATAVLVAAWNLSGPLSARHGGVPVAGLRCSITYLVVTVGFGVVYAFDRQTGWFPLLSHRVLAHAHIGLLGWLGITYVAVAEKLWPMFLLAHRPRQRAGAVAVTLLAVGVPPLAGGLLFAIPALAWPGAVVVVAGLLAHLTSLYTAVHHRRRALELLHAFLFTSAAFLISAIALAAVAALADVTPEVRARLVAAEVLALIAWLSMAVVGQAHKIVPFIAYSALRARGVRNGPGGGPLTFGDLFHHGVARLTYVVVTVGFAAGLIGMLTATPPVLSAGGIAIAAGAVLVTGNLATGPGRATRPRAAEELA